MRLCGAAAVGCRVVGDDIPAGWDEGRRARTADEQADVPVDGGPGVEVNVVGPRVQDSPVLQVCQFIQMDIFIQMILFIQMDLFFPNDPIQQNDPFYPNGHIYPNAHIFAD